MIFFSCFQHKLGCFKRKTFYDDDETDAVLQLDSPFEFAFDPMVVSQFETEGKSDQPPEEKSLLVDDEANNSIAAADEEKEPDYTKVL